MGQNIGTATAFSSYPAICGCPAIKQQHRGQYVPDEESMRIEVSNRWREKEREWGRAQMCRRVNRD